MNFDIMNEIRSIQKIQVFPVSPDLREKVICYFAQYGDIISMDYLPDTGFVHVQLKDSAAMEAVISRSEHRIGNDIINVSAISIHHWYPPDITILNDDCIREVFEKMSLFDLSAVAEVCLKFKTIANLVFSKKFANFDTSKNFPTGSTVATVRGVFRNFGSNIKSLYLGNQSNDTEYNNQIVKLMTLYCSDEDSMLTKITFDDFEMTDLSASILQRMQLIFKRLTYLGIGYGSHHKELVQLMSNCSELTELILIEVPCFDDFLKNKCEKLKTVRLRGNVQEDTIELLARSNSQIKNLIIDNIRVGIKSRIFFIVGTMFPVLEKLAITHGITMNTSEKNAKRKVGHLAKLKHLNSLTMYCYGLPVPEIIDALNKGAVPIQNLILSNFELDSKATDSFSKMSGLTTLQFNKVRVDSDQLVKIVKNAPVLNSLSLLKAGKITIADMKRITDASNKLSKLAIVNTKIYIFEENCYKEIARSVENRGNGSKLIIAGLTNFKLKVSNEVIEQNRQFLEIRGFLWPKNNEIASAADDSDSDDDEFDDDEFDDGDTDEESLFSGIEDLYYDLTTEADRGSGNNPLDFIFKISQQQRKLESVFILRSAHEMGVASQFGPE